MKRKIIFLIHGILNNVIPFPALIATSAWALMIIAIFNLDTITEPFWYVVTMFPLFIPPISCIVGIIRGIKNFKESTQARWSMILSITGLFAYIGMIILCGWLGSIM